MLFFLHAVLAVICLFLERTIFIMKTRITELFDIQYPVLQSGMQWLASAELAAAVSKAGGLGIISATRFMDNKPGLLEEFEKCRALAGGKPFGVNISMLPHKDYNDNTVMFFEAAYEGHVPVIETSGRSPAEYIQMLREWEARDGRDNDKDRIKIIHKCPSVRHALSAQRAGADAVTIVGFECAGHPGLADVSTMALIPVAKEKLSIPVVAGGGICDRNTFTAAMALGADGVIMGTRFVATVECDIHPNWKQLIIDSNENDTVVTSEIKVGDNDTLGAIVASCAKADLLVLFSDIHGLYTADPKQDPNATLIHTVPELTPEIKALAGTKGSELATGGMVTKIHAAEIATEAGVEMIICHGAYPESLYDIVAGKEVGTRFCVRKEGT